MAYEPSHNEGTAQIFLQPIAAPSILGLYGFAGATFMVAAHMAGWYGDAQTAFFLVPFAAVFGGLAQFLTAMWAFRARDGLATAIHGTWGSFWLAYGLLWTFFLGPVALIEVQALFPALAFWFFVVASITWVCAFAAFGESRAISAFLILLAAGATVVGISYLAAISWLAIFGSYWLIAAAIAAWYCASALLLEEAYGREVWKLGRSRRVRESPPITLGTGEPGVIRGQ